MINRFKKYTQNTLTLYMFAPIFERIHIFIFKYIFNNIATLVKAWNITYNFDYKRGY